MSRSDHRLADFLASTELAEFLPHRIFVKDLESRFVFCNRRFAESLGKTPEEFIGHFESEVSPAEYVDRYLQEDRTVFETGESLTLFGQETIAGTLRWTRTVKTPLRDAAGEVIGLVAHIEDISREEVADLEARRLRTIFEVAATAMAQAGPDGKLTYVNRAFLRLWGADAPESVLGTDVLSYWRDPEEAARVVQEITTRDVWAGEMDAVGRAGEPFVLFVSAGVIRDDDGAVESMFATFIDITARKEAEHALARETSFQSLVADLSADFASIAHGPVEPVAASTLARLGEFFSVDRADLFRFSGDVRFVSSTASWSRDGVDPRPSELHRFPVGDAPWYVEQILEDRCVIYVPDVTALPAGSRRKRGYLEGAGIRSILVVPVYSGDDLYGFFVLDSERPLNCTDTEIHGIQMIARILAAAFATIEAHHTLEQRESLLRETERIGRIGSWNAEFHDGVPAVSWSPETYRILDLDPEAVAASFDTFLAAVHPEERDEVADAYDASVAGHGTFEVICRLRPSSEVTTYVRVFGINEYSKTDELVRTVGIIQDITETTRLEGQLLERNQALEASVTATAIAAPTGELVYVNQAFLDLWGVSKREEVIGSTALAFLPDQEEAQRVVDTILNEGTWSGEIKALRKNGTIFTALTSASVVRDAAGEVRRMIASFVDISERKEAERHARSSADKFRVLVNSSMEGYWLLAGDGRFLEVNEIACRMLGYTREEMLGMSIPDIEAVEKPEETQAHIQKLIETGYDRFETQHLRKDGTIVDVEVSTASYTGEEGIVFFAFIQDVSDRKRAETAIRERQVAEEANRAKTVFLSNITHELRTPMNAIMGFGQLLQFDGSLKEDQTESVREILSAGERLLALINGIIDLTSIESGTVELMAQPVGVHMVVHEALDVVRALAGERRVRIDAPPENDSIIAAADRERLRQVLVNLLTNAIRYNEEGGTVAIRAIPPAGRNDPIRIEVADTGVGIPVEQQAKVFTSFDRVGREAGNIPGTGIGLVYSKRLIELMGGSIGFTSEVGVGSTFWVELPRAAPER